MRSLYAWTITRDYFAEETDSKNLGIESDVGVVGPHNAGVESDAIIAGCAVGDKFRMYDDDGNLYYSGCIIGDFNGFEPLDDFGTPNAGCTEIRYYRNRTWETL